MKKIILGSVVSPHQKFLLYSFIIGFFLIGLGVIVWYIQYFMGEPMTQEPYASGDLLGILLFLASFVLLGITLSKQGLVINEGRLYQSVFLFKRPIRSNEIELSSFSDVTLMAHNLNRKYAFGASPNPDQSYDYKEYRVYLLNATHSKKHLIAKLKEREKAKELAGIIEKELRLSYSKYNPPISKKTRMRRR